MPVNLLVSDVHESTDIRTILIDDLISEVENVHKLIIVTSHPCCDAGLLGKEGPRAFQHSLETLEYRCHYQQKLDFSPSRSYVQR